MWRFKKIDFLFFAFSARSTSIMKKRKVFSMRQALETNCKYDLLFDKWYLNIYTHFTRNDIFWRGDHE